MKTPWCAAVPGKTQPGRGAAQQGQRSVLDQIQKFKTGDIGAITGCATDLAEAVLADWVDEPRDCEEGLGEGEG